MILPISFINKSRILIEFTGAYFSRFVPLQKIQIPISCALRLILRWMNRSIFFFDLFSWERNDFLLLPLSLYNAQLPHLHIYWNKFQVEIWKLWFSSIHLPHMVELFILLFCLFNKKKHNNYRFNFTLNLQSYVTEIKFRTNRREYAMRILWNM